MSTTSTLALTAPKPGLLTGTNDVVGRAPRPTLLVSLVSSVNSIVLRAPTPLLSIGVVGGGDFTASLRAPLPRISGTINSPVILTLALRAPKPRLLMAALAGNTISAILRAPALLLDAASYPESRMAFAGRAPAPYMSADLGAAIIALFNTWVLNTRKYALTEYGSEFAYNSYALFNGKVLACGAAGIVELGTQDQDGTTPIDAVFRTGASDFQASVHKRVPRAYIGYETTGDMIFRTITGEGGERAYLLGWNNSPELQQRRIPIGKGPKSRYWQFEAENVAGAHFSVNDILIYPVKLRRRVM